MQTNDIAALSITSPANYAGALVLNVTESWTNADGSTGSAIVSDNVEVFAEGAPIFALSGDDFLTGVERRRTCSSSRNLSATTSSTTSMPAKDQIDLIGYAGFASFADVKSHLTEDANGNAVITLADGQSITLYGVAAAALSASNFVFDQTPVTNNAGTMTIGDGAMLPLSGIINNTGTIALELGWKHDELELIQNGITLQGGGQVMLSDSERMSSLALFQASRSPTWTTRSLAPASLGIGRRYWSTRERLSRPAPML